MILKFNACISYLQEMRTIHMYLPDDYLHSYMLYPVLYMFDGHNLFNDEDATYGRSWRLQEELEKRKEKCIVVGIECSHNGNQRLNEYSPYPFYDEEFGSFEGWGQETMDFIIHELKPYIDAHFPTKKDRNHTWIAGSSCGGLMSLYAAIKYSFYFSKFLVISPYIYPMFADIVKDMRSSFIHPETNVYMSWGSKEEDNDTFFVQETKCCTEIINLLQEKEVHTQMNVRLNGRHCEKSWQEEASDYLPFLFKKSNRN